MAQVCSNRVLFDLFCDLTRHATHVEATVLEPVHQPVGNIGGAVNASFFVDAASKTLSFLPAKMRV